MKTTEEFVKENNIHYTPVEEKTIYISIGARLKMTLERNNDLTILSKRLSEADVNGVYLSCFESEEFTTALVEFIESKISDDDLLVLIELMKNKLKDKVNESK